MNFEEMIEVEAKEVELESVDETRLASGSNVINQRC